MKKSEEVWKPVVGWEGFYEVSSWGRVRSTTSQIPLKRGGHRLRTGKIRALQSKESGHLSVDLKRSGERKTYLVHRLIAEAFIPNPDNHPVVRHLNDVPTDNRLENLAWGTRSDNLHDMVRNGLHFFASRAACSRGHEYTPESTRMSKRQRTCRLCRKEDYGVKEPPSHGTYSGYVTFGCRCDPCREAGKVYRKERREKGRT